MAGEHPLIHMLRAAGMQVHPFEPDMDIAIVGGAVLIRLDVPGLTMEQISIRKIQGMILIQGERVDDLKDVQRLMHERPHSPFRRAIPLQALPPLDPDAQPHAVVSRGVLTITLPMLEADPDDHGVDIPVREGDQ